MSCGAGCIRRVSIRLPMSCGPGCVGLCGVPERRRRTARGSRGDQVVALGLVSLAIAGLLLLAESHLSTGGLIGAVALVAFAAGVALLLIGAAAGLPAVIAVSGGVWVASVGGLVLLGRSLRTVRRLRPPSRATAIPGPRGSYAAKEEPWPQI